MTVRQLMEKLEKVNPDANVAVEWYESIENFDNRSEDAEDIYLDRGSVYIVSEEAWEHHLREQEQEARARERIEAYFREKFTNLLKDKTIENAYEYLTTKCTYTHVTLEGNDIKIKLGRRLISLRWLGKPTLQQIDITYPTKED